MTVNKAVEAIVNAVRSRIGELSGSGFLSTGDAFPVAKAIAEGSVPAEADGRAAAVRGLLIAADPECRVLVAAQLVGMTYADVVSTVTSAVRRFCGTELEIVPIPTLAFSGYCERHDIWNLYSNGIKAKLVANDLSSDRDPDGFDLRLALQRSLQMLHFLTQREVLVESIDGKPYDGHLREQVGGGFRLASRSHGRRKKQAGSEQ